MTFDHLPLRDALDAQPSLRARAVAHFLSVMENLFGGTLVIPRRTLFHDNPRLTQLVAIANAMRHAGILKGLQRSSIPDDEPHFRLWRAEYSDHQSAGGIATDSDETAATAAVAEALERAIWTSDTSYARARKRARTTALHGAFLSPLRYAGVARTDAENEALAQSEFTWIKATSLSTNKDLWIPAQTVSRAFNEKSHEEPRIRPIITTGLATGVNRTNALLGGLLECIERDAFTIMWGNQLSLPSIAPEDLAQRSLSLATLIDRCTRYGLTVRFVRLITDAPAYVIMAVVTDTHSLPPITIGMSAHARAESAAEKALLEALRARVNARYRLNRTKHMPERQRIRGGDRSVFWADPTHASHLSFLTTGAVQPLHNESWESDTPEAHLARIIAWCTESGYACASVALTGSTLNVTPWHVEYVVVPELQPMHYDEAFQTLYGARMRDIPARFGFTARTTPFTALPHPFV